MIFREKIALQRFAPHTGSQLAQLTPVLRLRRTIKPKKRYSSYAQQTPCRGCPFFWTSCIAAGQPLDKCRAAHKARRLSVKSSSSGLSGWQDEGGNSDDGSSAERLPGQVSRAAASTSYQDKNIEVMLLWMFAYIIHPQWIIPLGLELFIGMGREQLSARGEALLHMVMDLGMLGFTVGILRLCLKKYKPRALGWFRSWAWPPAWTLKVLLACTFAFPLAMFLADFSEMGLSALWLLPEVGLNALQTAMQNLIPLTDSELGNAIHLEQTIRAGDLVTKALYFVVLTICAPIWEEVMFRGFLMPSLARYMPLWTAVVLSALIFACVHFSLRRFLVLALLGLVFGALYAESHNLAAAITAHSLWNAWVLAQFLMEQTRPALQL